MRYDETNYKLLAGQLASDHSRISVINRAQLLDDGLNIARANLLDYGKALDLTRYLAAERHFVPWRSAFVAFDYVDNMLVASPIYANWKVYLFLY